MKNRTEINKTMKEIVSSLLEKEKADMGVLEQEVWQEIENHLSALRQYYEEATTIQE